MTRRALNGLCIALLGSLALMACRGGEAPTPPARKPTVALYNLVSHPILDASVTGIKAGLTDAGYPLGTIQLREVSANGEMAKLDAIARELLSTRPDVIVPISTPVTQAVVNAAPPQQNIVFSTVTNPADVGMTQKPRNLTGVSDAVNYQANIDLIFELFPEARTLGMMYNAGEVNSQYGVDAVKAIAGARGFGLELAVVTSTNQVADAAQALVQKVDVFYVGSDNTVVGGLAGLLKVADDARKPVIASDSGSVAEGALAAVSVDYEAVGRRAGELVAQVLRSGAAAGTIDNLTILGDSLLLNDAAAARLGFTFPRAVRARAARVVAGG